MYPFFIFLKTFLFFPVIAVRRKVQPEKRREREFQAVERAFIGRPVKRGETKQYYAGNEKPVAQKPCDFDARKFSAINTVHSRYDKNSVNPIIRDTIVSVTCLLVNRLFLLRGVFYVQTELFLYSASSWSLQDTKCPFEISRRVGLSTE